MKRPRHVLPYAVVEYVKVDDRDPLQGAPLDMPTAFEFLGTIPEADETPSPLNGDTHTSGTSQTIRSNIPMRAPAETMASAQAETRSSDPNTRNAPDLNQTKDSGVSELSNQDSTNSDAGNLTVDAPDSSQPGPISQNPDTNNNSSSASFDSMTGTNDAPDDVNRSRTEAETSSSSLNPVPQGLFDAISDLQQSTNPSESDSLMSRLPGTQITRDSELPGVVLHVDDIARGTSATTTTVDIGSVASTSTLTTAQTSPTVSNVTINLPVISQDRLREMRARFKAHTNTSVTNKTVASTMSTSVSMAPSVCTATAGQVASTSTVITTNASSSVSHVTSSVSTTPVTCVSSIQGSNLSQAPSQQGTPVTQISASHQSAAVDLTQDDDEENQPPSSATRMQPQVAGHGIVNQTHNTSPSNQAHGAIPPHLPQGGTLHAPVGIPSQRVLGTAVIGDSADGAADHQQQHQSDHGGGSVTPDSIPGSTL